MLEQGVTREREFAAWMREVEVAAPQTYTDILACAEDDREFFRAHDLRSRLTLPIVRCGVDPRLYALSPGMRLEARNRLGLGDKDRLFIFSASNFGPNYEALHDIKEFCVAEAEFMARNRAFILVVGSVSSEAYRQGALIVTGRVPEVLPYFAASDAGINLVTRGSGSNVKIFEYLAARLPVISTVIGVRGTQLTAFEDYLPCNRDNLREVIQHFIGSDRTFWSGKAESVWERHKHYCDIQSLVSDAVSLLPAFGN